MDFADLHAQLHARLGVHAAPTTVRRLQEHFDRAGCQDCDGLVALNTAMLALLHQRGYLPTCPQVVHDHEGDGSSWTRGFVWYQRPALIHLCERAGGVLAPLSDHRKRALGKLPTQASWAHWRTLFHEVGHTVLAELDAPFCHPDWSVEAHAALHRTVLGPMADRKADAWGLFKECFADVYAVMVLWHLAGPSEALAREVTTLMALRRANRQHDPLGDTHLTDLALARAWADRATWQALPAAALLERIQRYASEGWVDLMDPARDAHGAQRWDRLLAQRGLGQATWIEAWTYALDDPQELRWSQWRAAQADHPLMHTFDAVLAQVAPQALPRPGGAGRAHRDRLRTELTQALHARALSLEQILRADEAVLIQVHPHQLGRIPRRKATPPSLPAEAFSFWERLFLGLGQARY